MRLENKVALITGAARGQGEAEARLFSEEGASVVIADVLVDEGRRVATAISESGGNALFVKLDVTSEADWKNAVQVAVERFGRLDILVNNAAVLRTEGLLDTTEQIWDQVMAINATGVFLGTREVIPVMRRNGGGSVVNISSGSGVVGSPIAAAYHASKGAVRIFTRSAAVQYASENIRVNAVNPANVETPMLHDAYPASQLEASRQKAFKGRFAMPEEIAAAVLYLASDESSYVTGAELAVDGGATAR